MWLLKDSYGKLFYLKPNKTFSVGRKQADITLENDSSISRVHATIEVKLLNDLDVYDKRSICTLKDAHSKYGISITRNGMQIKVTDQGLDLQSFDIIKFGLQQHVFEAKYIHFVTMTSRLTTNDEKKLKDIMDHIGGIIISDYNDNCTHLTATTATSTNKIILALIEGLPIVNLNYWKTVEKSIETNEKIPDYNLFTLTLQDKGINTQRASLKPNPARKTLFKGKKFVFFSDKVLKSYDKMITKAGGEIQLYDIELKTIPDNFFSDNNIMIQATNESIAENQKPLLALLLQKMQKKKLRMIIETEIALAIIYASTDQYCNPKYHFKKLMKRKFIESDSSEILAVDTQENTLLRYSHENKGGLTCNTDVAETEDKFDFSSEENENSIKNENIINLYQEKNQTSFIDIEKLNKKGNINNSATCESFTKKLSSIKFESNECTKKRKYSIDEQVNNDFGECSSNINLADISENYNDNGKSTSFLNLKKQNKDLDQKNEIELSELGFKIKKKKIRHFDLDSLDVEKPHKDDNQRVLNNKLIDSTVNKKTIEKIETKSLNLTKKNSSSLTPDLPNENVPNIARDSISHKQESCNNFKTFKKVPVIIPEKRIMFS